MPRLGAGSPPVLGAFEAHRAGAPQNEDAAVEKFESFLISFYMFCVCVVCISKLLFLCLAREVAVLGPHADPMFAGRGEGPGEIQSPGGLGEKLRPDFLKTGRRLCGAGVGVQRL